MNLTELRLRRGLSIPQLALQAGVSAHAIRRYEAGDGRPHPKNQLALAEFFELDVLELFPLEDEETAA